MASVAMAASTALPPRRRMSSPTSAANGWLAATMPFLATTTERLCRGFLAGRSYSPARAPRRRKLGISHQRPQHENRHKRGSGQHGASSFSVPSIPTRVQRGNAASAAARKQARSKLIDPLPAVKRREAECRHGVERRRDVRVGGRPHSRKLEPDLRTSGLRLGCGGWSGTRQETVEQVVFVAAQLRGRFRKSCARSRWPSRNSCMPNVTSRSESSGFPSAALARFSRCAGFGDLCVAIQLVERDWRSGPVVLHCQCAAKGTRRRFRIAQRRGRDRLGAGSSRAHRRPFAPPTCSARSPTDTSACENRRRQNRRACRCALFVRACWPRA